LVAVWPLTLHQHLQDKFLVVALHKREEGLDAIEVWAVRDIEDLLNISLSAEILHFFGLVDLEVVHEHGELIASKAVRKNVDKIDELLCTD
jgi:hypothetical protein